MNEVNLHVISKGRKNLKQEVQGVIVNKVNNEFVFNYNTAKDPTPDQLEVLKDFRNRFVEHLVRLNFILGDFKE